MYQKAPFQIEFNRVFDIMIGRKAHNNNKGRVMDFPKAMLVSAMVLLAACGDDNQSPDYSYPSTYEFSSNINSQESSVYHDWATTNQQFIQELQLYIESDAIQQEPSAFAVLSRLNRIYLKGTADGEDDYDSLLNRGFFSGASEPTQFTRETVYDYPLDIADYSQLTKNSRLSDSVTGNGLLAPRLINKTETEAGLLVGRFVGFPLYTDIPDEDTTRDMEDGNEMPNALIEDWLNQLAEVVADPSTSTVVTNDGLHLNILINKLLVGSVIYAKAVNHGLNPSYGLSTPNDDPYNLKLYETSIDKRNQTLVSLERSIRNIKALERNKYSAELTKTELEIELDELQLVKDQRAAELASIDKVEDPDGWFAANQALDEAELAFGEKNTDYQDAVKRLNQVISNHTRTVESYEYLLESEEEALNDIPNLSNTTLLQRFWDQAFGLFGALRNHNDYTDLEILSSKTSDANGDGTIQVFSEFIYDYAQMAAEVDSTSELANHNFSETIMNAFLMGRQIITQNYGKEPVLNQGYHVELAEQANIITSNWDKLIAAKTIHYLNATLAALSEPTPLADLEGGYFFNWSHLKGIALTLQFSPHMAISVDDLEIVHGYIGTAPILDEANLSAHRAGLESARDMLQASYDFAESNVMNW
jgi:hypothetical protein